MKNSLLEHSHARITALCRKHGVRHLYAFGSVLTPRFTDESDVDFLVDFNTDEIGDYLTNYFELKDALQEALGREVDLVEEKAVRNPIFKRNIERTKTAVYGLSSTICRCWRVSCARCLGNEASSLTINP